MTVTVAVASARLTEPTAALARITADPAATPVTGMTTVVALAGMVTDGVDTVATLVLFDVILSARPPAGAGPDNVRVRFRVSGPVKVRLGGVKAMVCAVFVVIETVAGELLVNPSLTINCTTNVPSASAMNTGEGVVAARSVAVLPAGRLANDQE